MIPHQPICYLLILLTFICLSENHRDVRQGLFATKTPFSHHDKNIGEWVSPQLVHIIDSRKDTNCKLLHLNTLFRHGIRNPGPKDIIRAENFFTKIKNHLTSDKGFRDLPDWSSRFPVILAKELSETGAKELVVFGDHYRTLFYNIDFGNTRFISSSTNRTKQSCSSFVEGFTKGTNKLEKNNIVCLVRNDTLRFFDECKKYLKTVEEGYREYKAFQKGPEVHDILENFKTRWNFNVTGLTYKDLKAAYATAGTEISTFGNSPWLELFSEEDLEVLEYASDLKGYWKKGYGNRVNYEQSCVLLREIFLQLDQAADNQTGSGSQAVFRFGHSETLLPLLCLLGLYKDELPLRADNFKQQKTRKFKAGYMSPFAANLDFVLFKCQGSEDDATQHLSSEVKIMLVHNEKPTHFPCCPDDVVCPYHTVRDYYARWVDDCDFDELCDHELKDGNQLKEEL